MRLRIFIKCKRCGNVFETKPGWKTRDSVYMFDCYKCNQHYSLKLKDMSKLIYKLKIRNLWNEVNEQEV